MDKGNRGCVKSTSAGYSAMIDISDAWAEIDKLVGTLCPPPEGWKNSMELGREWGVDQDTAKRRANRLVQDGIMGARRFKGNAGHTTLYFAPISIANAYERRAKRA
jgi:hypothetical protein